MSDARVPVGHCLEIAAALRELLESHSCRVNRGKDCDVCAKARAALTKAGLA